MILGDASKADKALCIDLEGRIRDSKGNFLLAWPIRDEDRSYESLPRVDGCGTKIMNDFVDNN
jgi:hypothetical protein